MFYLAIAIFVITYAGIMLEKIPRTYVALAGGLAMIFLGLLTQDDALRKYIDFNTLGLLVGMMMMVGVIRKCGIFEALAIWATKITRARPMILLALLSVITAIASSLFDSVTAVLLLAPMSITLARRMEIEPYPFLIMEILISNIGGTALMIGNPPNVMIGSATGLTFNAFFMNLAPGVVLTMLVIVPILAFIYRRDLTMKKPLRAEQLQALDPLSEIKDWSLLYKSLIVMAITILGFVLHSVIHIPTAVLAMAGATVLMVLSGTDVEEAMAYVQWDTLFFFMGLFVLVGGLEEAGVIDALAHAALTVTDGDLLVSASLIMWLAAIASAFVDNIPFTAKMIPVITQLQQLMGSQADVLWWSLALGACYGGNGTLIGASPNLIIASLAGQEGYRISFLRFMKLSFPLMLLSVLVAQVYIYARYFLFG